MIVVATQLIKTLTGVIAMNVAMIFVKIAYLTDLMMKDAVERAIQKIAPSSNNCFNLTPSVQVKQMLYIRPSINPGREGGVGWIQDRNSIYLLLSIILLQERSLRMESVADQKLARVT